MAKGNFGYVIPEDPYAIKGAHIDVTKPFKNEVLSDNLMNHVRYLYGVNKNCIQVISGEMILDSYNGRLWFFVNKKRKITKIELERYMPVTEYLEDN